MHTLVARVVAAALLSTPAMANAQTITGTITGVVKDSSQGVLPGTTITMTQLETNRQETAVCDTEGRYRSLPLPLGTYRVEASLSGFRNSVQSGVTLTVDEVVRVDFVLAVGTVQEIVE